MSVNLQIKDDPTAILIELERSREGHIFMRANGTILMSISDIGEICINLDTYKNAFDRVFRKITIAEGMTATQFRLEEIK